jgi:hypothetical protein
MGGEVDGTITSPDGALAEIRRLTRVIAAGGSAGWCPALAPYLLAELVAWMDAHLTGGGVWPTPWAAAHDGHDDGTRPVADLTLPGARPWRAVTGQARWYAGRGSFLGPDTARRGRWWQLPLECGHTEERTVRYGPPGDGYSRERGGTQHRAAGDILPAPRRVRCGQCPPAIQ